MEEKTCTIPSRQSVNVHSGLKEFSCDFCSKCFLWKSELEKHVRTHTGEKPFSCSVCHKSFSQRSSLNVQMKIHSESKEFSCNVCSKCFSRKDLPCRAHENSRSRETILMFYVSQGIFSEKCSKCTHKISF